MPKELIIASCSALSLYLIIVVIISVLIHSLNKKIIRREKAINVIMAEKYDLIISLGTLMDNEGINLPQSIKNTLNLKNYENLKVYNTMERLSIKTLLMKTVDTLFFISEENGLLSDERYLTLKKSIENIDVHHRKDIATYNSQVVAYNYWVKCLLFRPYSFIFKIKTKEIMY